MDNLQAIEVRRLILGQFFGLRDETAASSALSLRHTALKEQFAAPDLDTLHTEIEALKDILCEEVGRLAAEADAIRVEFERASSQGRDATQLREYWSVVSTDVAAFEVELTQWWATMAARYHSRRRALRAPEERSMLEEARDVLSRNIGQIDVANSVLATSSNQLQSVVDLLSSYGASIAWSRAYLTKFLSASRHEALLRNGAFAFFLLCCVIVLARRGGLLRFMMVFRVVDGAFGSQTGPSAEAD
ncbi:MAG: uncharacterized protein KVP18_004182 [Porospora cf. gigantea A]|uniref:uncharacterized protein n=1 Tax=Porospora cf. gigantea A TaxID=2853593 RepID=UPI003559ED6A|nr:MAG: hypothetical protein KVP18_004182 [Porospora cf. gigantea A]